jgi:ribulose-phosphate 3-epimerase
VAPSDTFATLAAATPTLSVGILTADLLSLGSELALLEGAGVTAVHLDVMDGCFCPMMTVGPPFVKALRTSLFKDVHLMIDEPLAKLADYVSAGADMVTVHVEASRHPHRVLQQLGEMANANDPARGLVRGVALNPGTPVEAVEPLLDEVEMVLLLAVNPGWGGQRFRPATFDRLARTKDMVSRTGRRILVGVDGGITKENVVEVARAGADLIVTGSAVFDGKTPARNVQLMLEAVQVS